MKQLIATGNSLKNISTIIWRDAIEWRTAISQIDRDTIVRQMCCLPFSSLLSFPVIANLSA